MTDRLPGTKFLLFAVVCLLSAMWVASVTGNFRRLPFIEDVARYQAVIDDAQSLAVGDDVRLAGVRVGRVNDIHLERGAAVVSFEVDPRVQPTTTWQVGARWRNVIGQRYLYLYEQPGGVPLADGDRLPISQSVDVADVGRFFNEITPLLEALDPAQQNTVVEALNTTLLGREETIQSLVTNLAEVSAEVAAQEPQIRSLIANANLLLAEYDAREAEMLAFIDQLALVSRTLAVRNDEVIGAAVDIADVQAELADLIAANDAGLRDMVADLEVVTDEIGADRQLLDAALGSTRQGFATYMLISRWGQWFNVRAVATQVQMNGNVLLCTTETGTSCSRPNSTGDGSADPDGDPGGGPGGVPPLPDPLGGVLSLAPERLDALEVITGLPLAADGRVARTDDGAGGGS